jgi:hypothetical protein
MKIQITSLVALMLITMNAHSNMNCSVSDPLYEISLKEININPSASIGDVVAKSEQISKDITCEKSSGALWAYIPVSDTMQKTNVSISEHTITNGVNGSQDCPAIKTGYDGLGIVWYNFNQKTNAWQCVTSNIGVYRTLNHGTTTAVKDEIFLVKTGPLASGEFNFNSNFHFNEGWYYRPVLPNNTPPNFKGRLYEIKLKGESTISAPTCEVKKHSGSNLETFTIAQALSGSHVSKPTKFRLACDGYIEDGSIVSLKIEPNHAVYPYRKEYFSTSEQGVAVKMYLSKDGSERYDVITPANPLFDVVVNKRTSDFYIYHSPFIESDSGDKPINKDINYEYKITVHSS